MKKVLTCAGKSEITKSEIINHLIERALCGWNLKSKI